MRKILATSLAALAVAVAGCGGGSSGSGGKDPLDNALGYLPKSAEVVAAIDTDPNGSQWKALSAILRKFSFGDQIAQQLKQSISQQGLNYDNQVKPLLGNEVVLGSSDLHNFVVALQV